MPGLLENCRSHFNTDNLYRVLGVKKTATDAEVKKGYHKVSLKVHPDRVPEDEKEEATLKFQTLGKVYCILSNKEKRAVYDETGEVDDEDDAIPQDRDWTAYWRLLFRKVTTEDIEDFEKNYKGSEEELEDLKTAYVEFRGDMTEILNNVMCSTIEDEPRFTKIIRGWIKKKTVPDFPAFSKEKKKSKEKRKREAEKEAAEAEELKQELGIQADDTLRNMIQQRQSSREAQMGAFFDDLEAKYAQPKKQKTSTEVFHTEGLGCDELLHHMWQLHRNPKKKVARVSEERDYELHSRNTIGAAFATRLAKQMKEEGRPVRLSRWLPGEDRILIKNLIRFRKEYPEYDPVEIIHSKLNRKLKEIIKKTRLFSRMAEGLNRTTNAVYVRLKHGLFPEKDIRKGKYEEEERLHLENLYQFYGPKWKKIAVHLGRSEKSVFTRWLVANKTKTGRWSESENALLLEAIKNYKRTANIIDEDLHDIKNWSELAKAVPGRNSYQCRAHWIYKLRNDFMCEQSNLETVRWGGEEKSELVKLISDQNVFHEEDVDFDLIRKKFQEKGFVASSAQIRRQWRLLKSRVHNSYIKSFEVVLDELSERWL